MIEHNMSQYSAWESMGIERMKRFYNTTEHLGFTLTERGYLDIRTRSGVHIAGNGIDCRELCDEAIYGMVNVIVDVVAYVYKLSKEHTLKDIHEALDITGWRQR